MKNRLVILFGFLFCFTTFLGVLIPEAQSLPDPNKPIVNTASSEMLLCGLADVGQTVDLLSPDRLIPYVLPAAYLGQEYAIACISAQSHTRSSYGAYSKVELIIQAYPEDVAIRNIETEVGNVHYLSFYNNVAISAFDEGLLGYDRIMASLLRYGFSNHFPIVPAGTNMIKSVLVKGDINRVLRNTTILSMSASEGRAADYLRQRVWSIPRDVTNPVLANFDQIDSSPLIDDDQYFTRRLWNKKMIRRDFNPRTDVFYVNPASELAQILNEINFRPWIWNFVYELNERIVIQE